ncbi:GNAT family N-acetyltransferase [Qipengyuania sp.]|uniref:GNAT family N-acetyltransferase n=1 Tax=Qipengyuania sp. TaxID=2004515 RepID=UPI0035C7BC8C
MTEEIDLDGIMAVMVAAFEPHWREAWTRSQVRDSLAMPTTRALLMTADGSLVTGSPPAEVAAFTLSRQASDEEELLLIAVHPAHRGRGLGARLIEAFAATSAERGVKRIFLEMRANNPAQSLYRRSQFKPIGVRPSYYRSSDGTTIDAITFAREL